MQLIHPQGAFNNVQPENTFIALDDNGVQQGYGYIIFQYQEHLYPECPINMYFVLDSKPACRYTIFGALIARARQLRECNVNVHACMYTAIKPEDIHSREFYTHNGFSCEETENTYRLMMSGMLPQLPREFLVESTPLNTLEEQRALLNRLMNNDISYMDLDYLRQLMQMPVFFSIGLFYGSDVVGEAVVAGAGSSCELQALYISPNYRRQRIGQGLVARCMEIAAQHGVNDFRARFVSRSDAQMGIVRRFSAADLGVDMIYPCLYL